MNPSPTLAALVLCSLFSLLSCAGPHRGPAEIEPAADALALPTEWYCPWCGRESPPSPWSPSTPGTGQTEFRSPRHPGGLQFSVPREYPLHWGEGRAAPRHGPGPMTRADARQLLERWAADQPDMEVERVEDKGEVFEGTILRNGLPVGRVQVDKATGWFRQVQ